jgi:hypothetical protein
LGRVVHKRGYDDHGIGADRHGIEARKGFGLVILKTVVPAVFGGTAELHTRSSGACWHLEAPLNNVLAEEPKILPDHGVIGRKELTVDETGKAHAL